MGCLFVLIAVLSPRLALILTWIFTPWVDRATGAFIWPLLGLVFLPLTTLTYVILWNTGGYGVDGWEWIFVVLAVFADLASFRARRYGRRPAQAYQVRSPTFPWPIAQSPYARRHRRWEVARDGAFRLKPKPRMSHLVCYLANGTSRAHPAGDHRNLPHTPKNPRHARVEKYYSQG